MLYVFGIYILNALILSIFSRYQSLQNLLIIDVKNLFIITKYIMSINLLLEKSLFLLVFLK